MPTATICNHHKAVLAHINGVQHSVGPRRTKCTWVRSEMGKGFCTWDREVETFTNSTFCPHSVFVCFVWIWEQTAIISLYNINWLVFITNTQCVYSAVRNESLYIILRSAHTVCLCGSENKQRLFPYTALTGFYNREGVYCAVRTGSLYITEGDLSI